jgi:hypothetical protein
MRKWNYKTKQFEETGNASEKNIGFLSENTRRAGALKRGVDKGKPPPEKKATGPTKTKNAFKIPKGIEDLNSFKINHLPDIDIIEEYRVSVKDTNPYSLADLHKMNIVTDKHFNDFPGKSESVKDSSCRRFSVFQVIWMIFACIVLGCILASATVTLLLFLNTPAGRTISVLAVLLIFIWMKKKGWLPL